MRTTKFRTKHLGGLAILAVASIVACSGRRLHAGASRIPGSNWTEQQISEHAIPLIQTLAPEQSKITVEINASTVYRADGIPQHLCYVDALVDTAGHAVHTVWNADTGKLIQIGQHPSAATEMQMVTLDARGAEAVARQWLEKLGMVKDASAWQVARPSSICKHSCTVFLQHDRLRVVLIVQRQTHDLSYACLTDTPNFIQQKRFGSGGNVEYYTAQEDQNRASNE